ncbi:hypothetical protein CVIRNUC_005792 [Coccomyxa viridis]|uniref:Uncharacterized protein n=1 Tax=Coccomyxa viridis TaxID=1274662 RepID=A0AAV1I6C4_9CHLO|nr:hypothetical protein CVIRNUC_005792 [Coccomyxa viridis]
MTMAYRSMSRAFDADAPECQEILQDVTLAGCHIPSGKLCKAAISLIRDGVVKPVALEDGRTALQLAAPLLEQELQGRVLASWQGKAYEDLTDPPLEGGRSLGIYLLESALHWLDLDRLLQKKVEKAGGQVLEYAFQHEISRGLSQVLSSKPQLASKQWRLERARAAAQSIYQKRSPLGAQKQQAVDYSSAHATMPLASFELDEPVDSLVEEAVQTILVDRLLRTFCQGQLDKRRLDICVGSYGFELMSGGSKAQVEEHAARSLVYAKLHGLELVFAVHFIVQRAATRQQPVTFPTWPAIPKANEQTRIIELQGPPSMDEAIKATAPSRGPLKIKTVLAPAGQVLWPAQQASMGMHLLKPAVQLEKRRARPILAPVPARHAGWSMQHACKLR